MLKCTVIKINYRKLRFLYMRHAGKETKKYCKRTMFCKKQ